MVGAASRAAVNFVIFDIRRRVDIKDVSRQKFDWHEHVVLVEVALHRAPGEVDVGRVQLDAVVGTVGAGEPRKKKAEICYVFIVSFRGSEAPEVAGAAADIEHAVSGLHLQKLEDVGVHEGARFRWRGGTDRAAKSAAAFAHVRGRLVNHANF